MKKNKLNKIVRIPFSIMSLFDTDFHYAYKFGTKEVSSKDDASIKRRMIISLILFPIFFNFNCRINSSFC